MAKTLLNLNNQAQGRILTLGTETSLPASLLLNKGTGTVDTILADIKGSINVAGDVYIAKAPTQNLHGTNKLYVDSLVSSAVGSIGKQKKLSFTGAQNAVNTVFTITEAKAVALDSLQVFVNGILQSTGDYTANASTVTFSYAPESGDKLVMYGTAESQWTGAIGGGSGGSGSAAPLTFLDLPDTPASYTPDKWVKVNSTGTGIEFTDAPSGSGGAPSGSGGSGAVTITAKDFAILYKTMTLTPNTYYIVTDFFTSTPVVGASEVYYKAPVEPIEVFATANNSYYKYVKSLKYEGEFFRWGNADYNPIYSSTTQYVSIDYSFANGSGTNASTGGVDYINVTTMPLQGASFSYALYFNRYSWDSLHNDVTILDWTEDDNIRLDYDNNRIYFKGLVQGGREFYSYTRSALPIHINYGHTSNRINIIKNIYCDTDYRASKYRRFTPVFPEAVLNQAYTKNQVFMYSGNVWVCKEDGQWGVSDTTRHFSEIIPSWNNNHWIRSNFRFLGNDYSAINAGNTNFNDYFIFNYTNDDARNINLRVGYSPDVVFKAYLYDALVTTPSVYGDNNYYGTFWNVIKSELVVNTYTNGWNYYFGEITNVKANLTDCIISLVFSDSEVIASNTIFSNIVRTSKLGTIEGSYLGHVERSTVLNRLDYVNLSILDTTIKNSASYSYGTISKSILETFNNIGEMQVYNTDAGLIDFNQIGAIQMYQVETLEKNNRYISGLSLVNLSDKEVVKINNNDFWLRSYSEVNGEITPVYEIYTPV
jgi:hypothetical protein